jgi:hypothetical protein
MTNSIVHTLAAFQKSNGFIVFAVTECTDSHQISADLQTQYEGGNLLRTFRFNAPIQETCFLVQLASQAIVKAGFPSTQLQLELIDNLFSIQAIAA